MNFRATIACIALTGAAAPCFADTFSFQGKLLEAGQPASGSVNLAFRLHDDEVAGVQVGPELSLLSFDDFGDAGEFTIDLDFGAGAFPGADRWLEVWVDGAPLSPRQPINPTPYAMHAKTVDSVPDGALPAEYADQVKFNNAANLFSGAFTGTFFGNGSGLSNIDASDISAGTLGTSFMPTGGSWGLGSSLNVDNSTFFIDPTNNRIGIGTSSPVAPLHVLAGGDVSPAGGGSFVIASTSALNLGFDSNEIMARDNGAVSSLFLNNDGGNVIINGAGTGDVGIGTSSPQADLHIRGDGSTGSLLITPDVSQGTSQVFLSEQASTSFGMIMRYDGGANKLHFLAQQSGVETAPLVTINRSSTPRLGIGTAAPAGSLHVAAGSGNSSVILPTDAIASDEMQNEPGLAHQFDLDNFVAPSEGWAVIAEETINCPSPGYIVAIGTSSLANSTLGSPTVNVAVAENAPPGPAIVFEATIPGVGASTTATVQNVVTVGSAGARTVKLMVETNGNIVALNPTITLIFIPTAYGNVDV